jgi:hypothetical protein
MNFIEYFEIESKKLILELSKTRISEKKESLLKSIQHENINSPIIKEIKYIINKFRVDFPIEEIIPKILEEDNIFASFFYGKPQITPIHRGNIIKNYLSKFNVNLTKKTPTVNVKKHSLYYLGEYKNQEVYYYLLDKNRPVTHNEVLQRVKILENNVEYKNHLVIFDDVVNGEEISKNFPNLYFNSNITNIKNLINE